MPRRGRITASSARKAACARAPTRAIAGSSIRSTAPPISCTAFRISRSSIALERYGAIVAGLVYNPANDELFIAERGKGAFLNDKRIRVASRQKLAEAVVACGLPHYGRGDLALARNEIAAAQQHFAGLRRYGAAALDLAWIAAGRLDAYWERDLSPWDMAAGSILVREAGGFVSDLDGDDDIFAKGQVVAGNDTMHRELLRLLKEAGKEAVAP